MPVRESVTLLLKSRRLWRARILPAAAFLIASCARAPEVAKSARRHGGRGRRAGRGAGAGQPTPTGYRTAFDLVANRVHAVSHRDGRLVVDAGALDFLKYVDGGWKTSWLLGEKDEGKPASLVNGLVGAGVPSGRHRR